jgi:hypothetical protein
MKTLSKLLTTLTFLTLPILSFSQTQEKKNYSKIGLQASYPTNELITENCGIPFGINFSLGKEILPEVYAELTENHSWSSKKQNHLTSNFNSIGPTIIWSPTFGSVDGIYFGGGIRYKTFRITYNDGKQKESENYNGLGFTIKFGSEWNIGKGRKLYFETEYDQAKSNQDYEEVNLGTTNLSLGIKF